MNKDTILYLGGSPCAGKSSVAEILAADYGLNYLRLDDKLDSHIQSASPDTQPIMASLCDATCDEIWLMPPTQQTRREIQFYLEEFPLHQQDILQAHKPLLVEAAALLPCLVAPLISTKQDVLYMVPTAQFQRKHYSQRPWVAEVLRDCSDPEQAFDNWMRRDEQFARWVRRSALFHGLQTIIVDGSYDINAHAQMAVQHFGLA